ncbi:MAG: acetylxylan esterase [Planctomycetaceae bacterium]
MFPEFDKLPSHPDLPDPLVLFDGHPVTTPAEWNDKRRPELKALFEHYMYGYAPPAPEKIHAKVLFENKSFLDGKATLRETELKFGPPATPALHVLIILPNQVTGPVPVFTALNFCGNHAVVADPGVAISENWMYPKCAGCVDDRATEKGRGTQAAMWSADLLVERGYGLVTCYYGDIDPDQPDFTDGIHPHYLPSGQTQPGQHDWGSIRAWAWGLSRIVDHLVTLPEIDPKRICVTGHSRLGKTALVAAAFDERFALAAPHQSGTGGCALSRDNDQETVERINRVFPHWFNDEFVKFANHEDKLPIDQHLLMALVAPRPLLDTEGDQDKWANYSSSLRALQSADKVYKLLGARGLVGAGLVQGDESVGDKKVGNLVQYRRDVKHELNRDFWQRMLDFADAQLPEQKTR